MSEREMVRQFHEAMGLPVRERPEMPSDAEIDLRCNLLLEEAQEFFRACGRELCQRWDGAFMLLPTGRPPDLAAMAQENADVRYIAHGNDLAMGVPPEVFIEVARANAEKTPSPDPTKKPTKGPGWRPPDVAKALRETGP